MKRWIHIFLSLFLVGSFIVPAYAKDEPQEGDEAPVTGYEKPYAGEREALGFDPEGVEYKQNRVEDFQVVLVSSAPWAALFSYGATALVSKASRGTFKVDGDYSKAFLYGTVAGAAVIATVSVIGPKYDPAPNAGLPPPPRVLVRSGWVLPVLTARF